MIGAGIYAGATPQSIAPLLSTVKLFLVHLNGGCADAIRKANPHAWIGLRADLGDDNAQVNTDRSPSLEALNFSAHFIQTALAAVPAGTYSFVVGINEAWPSKDDKAGLKWRADFELTLCRSVQKNLKLPYAALSCPVGNLEAADVPLFADVFREAWAVNYHGYLGPGRTSGAEEIDPYYTLRPMEIWLPELQKLGIPLRLLCGECGTYAPPNTYANFDAAKEAALAVNIEKHYWFTAVAQDFTFYGACAYGVGTVGAQSSWDLTTAIQVLADAGKSDPQPAPIQIPGGIVPPTPIPTPTTKFSIGPGVAAEIAKRGDVAQSSEVYFKDSKGINAFSKTVGKLGEYTYSFAENKTHFIPFQG